MVARIKKNDSVIVLSGKDKGKTGTVIEYLPTEGQVLVKGIGIMTRHLKARKQGDVSGIKKTESYLDASRVMPICTQCQKPCRVNSKLLEGEKKARTCNRCNDVF
ncbi:50S ribosomal protein L24 [Candidatus Dependentiae bacterium Noda2021]|nr:50S ribosomal protein L24 [Candidatus Dependentiae bacterium Noda2021]